MPTKSTLLVIIFLAAILLADFVNGQNVVVSSYFNALAPEDEWTELLVIGDDIDLNNYTIRDNSNSQNWMPPATFSNPIWSHLRAGTIIMIWHRQYSSGAVPHALDLDKNDGFIQVHAFDPTYFIIGDPSQTLNLSAPYDMIQIRDAAGNHVHALGHKPGTIWSFWGSLPSPKLNHTLSVVSNEAVSVCPGTNINEYGWSNPQSGTTFTSNSTTFTTQGLPNQSATYPTQNSDYWRSLRQPSWPAPAFTATYNAPNITLGWAVTPDPYPADNTQGYMILRNTVNSFTTPLDGHTYTTGDVLGSATVIAHITPSTTNSYSDPYTLNCGDTVYYRIYAFRYTTDPAGNDFDLARGRAYNETQFGAASAGIPDSPAITGVIPTDASCGLNNGTITITATGVGGTIEYSIDGTTWQASNVFSGLAPGAYNVYIRYSAFTQCQVAYSGNPVTIGMIPGPQDPTSATVDRNNLCSDDAGNIVLTVIGGSGDAAEWFSGSCGGTSIGTGITLTLPSPTVTTTYYVYWTSAICGNTSCASVTVSVSDPPTASDAGNDQSWCGVYTTTLDGNPPVSGNGLWTQVTGAGSTTFADNTLYNTQATVTVYGTYTYRWTISTGTACPDSFDEVTVIFSDAAIVTAGSNSPVCEGNTILLTSSISNATYSWTGPNGFTSTLQNPQIPGATAANAGTYSVTVSNIPNGCPNTSDNTDVLVSGLPVAPVSAVVDPDSVCQGYSGDIQLTASGGNGDLLFWYAVACDGTVVGTGNGLVIPAPAVTTTYYTNWTSSQCGNSGCVTATFTVLDPPTIADAGADQSLCGVLSTIMEANDPDLGTGAWTAISGPGSVTFSDPSLYNSQVTVTAQGSYLLRWTIINGAICPPSFDEVTVNFGDALQVVAASNSPLCSGSDLNLTSSIANATYLWTGPGGFTSNLQNPIIPNAAMSNAGSYSVLVTSIPGGCPDTQDETDVIINQSAAEPVTVTSSLDVICAGYSGSLVLEAIGGSGASLEWYTGSCGGTLAGIGPTLTIPAPSVTTEYFARWISTDCGSSPCKSVVVTVEQPPTPAFAGGDKDVCNLLSTDLQANMPVIGSGQWTSVSGPGTVSFSDQFSPTSFVSVSAMGVYVLRWTISSGGICPSSSDEVSVEFSDQVTVEASSNSPVCEGYDITLFSSISGATYSWTGPSGFTSTVQNPVITAASAANSGDYQVIVSDIPGGCPTSTGSTTVSISSIPAIPAVNSQNINGAEQDVCVGSTVNYSIAAPVPGSTYTWSLTGGGIINPGGSSDIVDVQWFATSGSYDLSVNETSSAGCIGNSFLLTVNMIPNSSPAILITADNNPACAGSAITFTASVSDGGTDPVFLWKKNGVDVGTNDSVYILYTPSSNDQVTCNVTSGNYCADPATVTSNMVEITVFDSLEITCSPQDTLCAGTPALLSPGSGFAGYLWSDGSTGESLTVQDEGNYWVIVTDNNGCSGTDSVTVETCETTPVITAPNAFTPNSDGYNDRFMLIFSGSGQVSGFEMHIYNRWGQQVFSGKDITEGWDGTYKGKPCQTDVYAYFIKYTLSGESGGVKELSGRVTIIR